jgi:hypothetical protein
MPPITCNSAGVRKLFSGQILRSIFLGLIAFNGHRPTNIDVISAVGGGTKLYFLGVLI